MSRWKITDRSLEAIRQRATESVIWTAYEDRHVPVAVVDALWAAIRDREALLAMLDAAQPAAAAPDRVTAS